MQLKIDDLINNLRNFLGLSRAERAVTVRSDDIFLVSYPRSGNTWMRFLLGNLIFQNEQITFANLEKKVPDVHQHTDRYLRKVARPRVLKSHEYFDPRYGKVIYLVRDPRDVCISYYYYHLKFHKIDESYTMDQFTQRFISGDLDPYGSWGVHVGSWLGARDGTEGFLLIRYEDLVQDANKTLGKVVPFLNIRIGEALLDRAIQESSFDSMQRLEKQQDHLWKMLRKSRKDMFFIRAGRRDNWKSEMSVESKEMIENAWPKLMNRIGYQL